MLGNYSVIAPICKQMGDVETFWGDDGGIMLYLWGSLKVRAPKLDSKYLLVTECWGGMITFMTPGEFMEKYVRGKN